MAADTPLSQRVLREHVASVYFNYKATFLARLVFVLVLGGFMYLQLGDPMVLPFVVLHLALYLGMYFTPRWNPSVPAAESAWWARKITRIVTLLGFADALAPWIFVPAGNLPVTAALMVVMMGNCARAVQSLRPLKAALFGHTLPMMGGLIVALAWQGDSIHLFLAAFAAIYLVLMLRVGVQEHQLLADSLALRFEKEALAVRLEEQIAATERASEEKTRFLASASHDLRQPLHAIALFGAALENELRGRPEGAHAERLMRAVNALGTSLDTMLDVSRLDAGVVTPEIRAVQLDALFLPLNHMFSPQAEQKELQLRVRASGLWVRSDPQLLHRMLSNLIDNALKYTVSGGVTVTARGRAAMPYGSKCATPASASRPSRSDRIFEEFYQVGNPGRDRSQGLGIGLSIVQRLSRLLGHPLQVHSRPGRGTHFRVVLPAAAPLAGALATLHGRRALSRQRAGSGAQALPERVLLVDDEAEIREAMGESAALAWSDRGAGRGRRGAAGRRRFAAGRQARHRPFDLLMCDYRLADGDGRARCRPAPERPAATRRVPTMPLLLITGETSPDTLAARSGVRACPVLFKPVATDRCSGMMASVGRP